MTALAPDPALPARDVLLDAELVASLLAPRLSPSAPLEVGRCELLRAKYRVGQSLRVLYRLELAGSRHDVSARMFRAGRSAEEHRRARSRAEPVVGLEPVVHDERLRTVFWVFPNDRKLGPLGARIAAIGGLATGLAWRETRIEAYAPEKAATVACLGTSSTPLAYAKLYAAGTAARTARVHAQIRRAGRAPRVPALLGHSAALRALVVAALAGEPLAALTGAARQDGYRGFGAALARLHRLSPLDERRFSRLEPARLLQAADLIGRVRPDLAAQAHALARALRNRVPNRVGPDVCLHGDAHSKNVVAAGGCAGLLDLDQVAAGPAAADLGSALAALRYDLLVGQLDQPTYCSLADALLEGYASAAPLPDERVLRWHAAAALLAERALRAVNRLRTPGLERLDTILHDAQELLP